MNHLYRLSPGAAGSWQIEEQRTAGKDAKIPGEIRWVAIKWFGNLEQATLCLLNILAAIRDAQAEVKEAVNAQSEP